MFYEISETLNLIKKLKEGGNYEKAEEVINEGLNKEPYNSYLLTSLADLYVKQNLIEEASDIIDKVLSKDGNNQNAIIIKGDISLKKKKFSEAVEYFRNALYTGSSPYIYKRLIQSLIAEGKEEEALDFCLQVIASRPEDPVFMKLLARCYKELKYYKEAEGIYKKLVDKYPDDKFLYKDYLQIKSVDKSPEELIKELTAIIKVSTASDNIHIRLLLADTLRKTGRYKEGLEHYKYCLAISPEDIYILKQTGFCYIKMNKPHEAISILKDLFLNDPGDYYIKTSLISLYKETGQTEDFIKLIDEAIKKHQSRKSLWGLKKKVLKWKI